MRVLVRRQQVVNQQAIPLLSCSMDSIRDLASKHNKFLLMATTPSCPNGKLMRELLEENREKFEDEGIYVMEMAIDTKRCGELADHMEISACPTVVFYRNKTEVKRFVPSGEERKEVLEELLDFKGKMKRIE